MSQVMCLPEVDASLCISNDVHDVCLTLGIEAAAAVLFDQIKQTLQFDGSYTNERHLMLLCNFCTASAVLMPVSRHGINRSSETGALSRASFEEVTDQLIEAATYGDSDFTCAFSPAVMVGQRAPNVGTGICYPVATGMSTIDEQQSDSEEEIIFTSIDADVEMLTYQHASLGIEKPYSDCDPTGSLPAALHHSYVTPIPTLSYTPSSPKNRIAGRKRFYEPSSPRSERRIAHRA